MILLNNVSGICLAALLLIPAQILAESTITITLVNNSAETLNVSQIDANHGAALTIDAKTIAPQSMVTVFGTITSDVDLNGSISFNNDKERFFIRVRRLKHFGQPSFTMRAKAIRAILDRNSLRFNSDGIPNHLAFTAATVAIEPLSNHHTTLWPQP